MRYRYDFYFVHAMDEALNAYYLPSKTLWEGCAYTDGSSGSKTVSHVISPFSSSVYDSATVLPQLRHFTRGEGHGENLLERTLGVQEFRYSGMFYRGVICVFSGIALKCWQYICIQFKFSCNDDSISYLW